MTPVKKFTDRKTGVGRIWKGLQELAPAADAANETPVELVSEPEESGDEMPAMDRQEPPSLVAEQDAPAAPETRDVATSEATPTEEPTPTKRARNAAPREGSKTMIILDLLKREVGATLQEPMDATSWQKHSVRGFPACTVGKKMKLTLASTKKEDGTRVYSLPAS